MSNEEINNLMIAQFTSMTFNGITGENMKWSKQGEVTKDPKGMIIQKGAYVGLE